MLKASRATFRNKHRIPIETGEARILRAFLIEISGLALCKNYFVKFEFIDMLYAAGYRNCREG